MSVRLDGIKPTDVHFLDMSEVALLSFEHNEVHGEIISIILKSGYWFSVLSTPYNQDAVKSFHAPQP